MPGVPTNTVLQLKFQKASAILAYLTVAIGVLAVTGWAFNLPILYSIVPGWPSMKVLTALFFIIGGRTLLRLSKTPQSGTDRPALVGAVLVLVIGGFALLDGVYKWTEGFSTSNPVSNLLRMRMSAGSVLASILFGIALFALVLRKPGFAQFLALINASLGLFGIVALSYGLDFFAEAPMFATFSLNTAIATFSLALSILLALPHQGLMRTFTADAGGAVLRQLVPYIIGLPILLGWLGLKGEQLGWYQNAFGIALLAIAIIICFSLLAAHLARHLNRAEAGRRRAMGIAEAKDVELRQEHAHLLEAREKLASHARELEETVAKRTQKLQATIASLETFVYTIAHDLRAPLRAMQGFTIALQDEYAPYLDKNGQEYCSRIASASKRMDALLSDLLKYGRLSHIDVPTKLIDLNNEVQAVLSELREPIQSTRAEIEVVKPLPKVCAEPKILDQVLINLVENALKFVPPNVTPKIQIYANRNDGRVRIWVQDNGIGIAPEHQQRIFQVFQRLHSNDQYPGTGIGLAIVQKATEQMGGNVGVESDIGKGSRFWIELPAEGRCAT